MNVNYVILIENGYVLHDCWKRVCAKKDHEMLWKVVEGTRNGCVNLHRTSTMLELFFLDKNNPLTQELITQIKTTLWPRNELQSGW